MLKYRIRNLHGNLLLSAMLILSTVYISVSCSQLPVADESFKTETPDTSSAVAVKPVILYGIPADSFEIIRGHIRPNRFLSEILYEFGVAPAEVERLVRSSREVFDVRKIRAGKHYMAFTDRDSAARLRYFIYEHDPELLYIFSLNDSLNITPYRFETRSVIKFGAVSIETSLWDAMITGGINPELAVELSDIFAWTVDFFGLQKGDSFKVIYEERYVGDRSVGIGKIYGARYASSGLPVYAVPLIQQGKESYYNTDGTSLRKEFLKAPLRFSRVSSRYSSGRMHPILRVVRPHFGVDYAAPVGTPVYSVGDGVVISAGTEGESGRIVRVRHNSVYSTAYLHLGDFADGIREGVKVRQGDILGYVGSSGLSTGPHLDFRFYKNGFAVDPMKVEAPPVEPVSSENMEKFSRISTVTVNLLDSFR